MFRHGWNALLGDPSHPCLLSFQSQAVPLHPWAIELGALPANPDMDATCVIESGVCSFAAGLHVDLSSAEIVDLRIASWTREEATHALHHVHRLKRWVEAQPSQRSSAPFSSDIRRVLLDWQQNSDSKGLLNLIGLGCGSTPAGDDILVGMLAGAAAVGEAIPQSSSSLGFLRTSLAGLPLKELTTLASAQMLEAAGTGSFPEPLGTLADVLKHTNATTRRLEECMDRILSLGSTSGTALLAGFSATMSNRFASQSPKDCDTSRS